MKTRLAYFVRNYFGFSRKETNGFFVLNFSILFIFICPLCVYFFEDNLRPAISNQEQKELNRLLASLPEATKNMQYSAARQSYTSQAKELSYFDPNTVSKEELLRIGFSEKLANNLINYRNKGAKFYNVSQIERIYGMNEEFFAQIAPYIKLPKANYKNTKKKYASKEYVNQKDDFNTKPQNQPTYKPKTINNFELNQADTTTLKQIRGIGVVTARRIVAYREKLGGFANLAQLNEVYGITPEAIQELKKYTYLEPETDLRKIKINQVSAEQLSMHPYITAKEAKILIAYRTQHGLFGEIDDLKKIKALNEDIIIKLAPYLSF